MKKLLISTLLLLFAVMTFAQISPEEAVPMIEGKGIITAADDSPLTFEEFKTAVEKAFPGKGQLITGTGEVSRADFAMAMVKVLGLEAEANVVEEICTTAIDE
ncbi:MAG TPA: hypothetical protein PLM80_10455 [Mesotoga sp.]|nr:hypothetical protein [Mesotoga sp.]